MNNVIWFQHINAIGGVESVIWNVIRKYDSDITILYEYADPEQLYRFSHFAKLKKFVKGEKIVCKRLFINYNYERIEGSFEADDVYFVIHANYEYMGLKCTTNPSYHYLAVSQFAADAYERLCGIKPELFPNPITIDDDRKPLLLVSATRIRPDKGKLAWRMDELAKRLDERHIPFVWLVFCNEDPNKKYTFKSKSVVKMDSRLDIIPFLRKADYVVQLSDTEACCMTALETLVVKTHMIATKIPSFYEQGMNDDNTLFLEFDMSNIDDVIDRIYDMKDFNYSPKPDRWGEVLYPSKRGELEPMKKYLVEATENINACGGINIPEFGGVPNIGDKFELVEERYLKLSSNDNVAGKPIVKLINEIKDEFVGKNVETKEEVEVQVLKPKRRKK